METKLVSLWQHNRSRIGSGWLIVAGLAAVYYGAIQPGQVFRGIVQTRESGLTVIENSRHQHWYQPQVATLLESGSQGIVGGVLGGAPMSQRGVSEEVDHKIVRTSSFELVAEKPVEAARKIQQLAESAGGFLVSWQANGDKEATSVNLVIRVPAAQFESTRATIRNIAQRVESEHVQAEEVSRQYIDEEARLHNLKAQETQYLAILKLARTVKDTLEVSEKLNVVRSEIEQQQSEFNALSKQVESVAVTIALRKEMEARVFGLPWRPAYEFKMAARLGLEGLIEYSTSILSFLFYLPAILLWLATILIGAAIGWRVLRWAGRLLFVSKAPAAS